jgi:hypothetical protein
MLYSFLTYVGFRLYRRGFTLSLVLQTVDSFHRELQFYDGQVTSRHQREMFAHRLAWFGTLYPATQVTHSVSIQSRDGLVYQGFNPR